jgi:hypothetical protein
LLNFVPTHYEKIVKEDCHQQATLFFHLVMLIDRHSYICEEKPGVCNEENISAAQAKAKKHAWFSGADGDEEWPQCVGSASR